MYLRLFFLDEKGFVNFILGCACFRFTLDMTYFFNLTKRQKKKKKKQRVGRIVGPQLLFQRGPSGPREILRPAEAAPGLMYRKPWRSNRRRLLAKLPVTVREPRGDWNLYCVFYPPPVQWQRKKTWCQNAAH